MFVFLMFNSPFSLKSSSKDGSTAKKQIWGYFAIKYIFKKDMKN